MGRSFHAKRSQKGAHGCAILDDWSSLLGGCAARQLHPAVPLWWDGISCSRAALARDVYHVASLWRGHRGRPTPAKDARVAAYCCSRRRRGLRISPRLGVSNLTFLGRPLPTKGRVEQCRVACCSPPFSLARGKITPYSTSLFLCYSAIVRLWI